MLPTSLQTFRVGESSTRAAVACPGRPHSKYCEHFGGWCHAPTSWDDQFHMNEVTEIKLGVKVRIWNAFALEVAMGKLWDLNRRAAER